MPQIARLKKEFHNRLSTNIELMQWLTDEPLSGIWYFNLSNPENIYINDSFWKSLNYTVDSSSTYSNYWSEFLLQDDYKNLLSKINESSPKSPTTWKLNLEFFNKQEIPMLYKAEGTILTSEKPSGAGMVIKFTNISNEYKISSREKRLLGKLRTLDKLNQVFDETNEIARIGGWEVDIVEEKLYWTKVTKDIHEVSQDFEPDLKTGINFYKEGRDRELITELFNRAATEGIPYDVELKLITAKGREIWVRAFGKPEFKKGKLVRVYGAFQDIDAKKKRDLAFAATKERFEKIFTHSSIGIVLVNRNNQLEMINNAAKQIFDLNQLNPEEVMGLTYKDLIHPENLLEMKTLRERLLSGEIEKYKIESKFITPNGRTIWCNVNTSIVYGESPEEDLIISQAEDITELKRLEKISWENSQKFKNAFEHSPNGMGVISMDFKWLMVNKNLAKMIGYEKEEFLRLDYRAITHPEDLKNDTQFLKEIIANKRDSYSVQKRYFHKDGHIVYGYLNVSCLRDERGHAVSLIGEVADITKLKKSEEKVKASLNDLQSLLDATSQVSIIETDLTGVARKFNKGAENLLGYKASDVVGKMNVGILHEPTEIENRAKELSLEYGEEIGGFDTFIHKAKLGHFDSGEWTYIRKDGSKFPVQLVVTATTDTEGTITGYLGVATDISELKEMEKSLVKSKLKAEAASKSKSEFLANMSHEIRTPLNGVIGFTDLLMRTKLNKSQLKYMQTVHNSANTLLDLVNDILDFSKIEAGKLELSEEKINLSELCIQTIDMVKHQAHSKGLEVLLNISADRNQYIHVDSVRLRQILTNLLGNAVKFTESGEIELKVEVEPISQDASEMRYTFSIRDTGIGIDPKNLSKIFYAFDQEDASTTRKYGGTGLGLTISNKLLQLMDSQLEVDSKPGIGSTFYFTVDYKTEIHVKSKSSKFKSIKNVLVVDDNESNRTILEEILAEDKILTTLASNGVEAIEILNKNDNFDLAIIDYNMPYLNGIDLIKHIRKTKNITSTNLPIILLHSSGEDKVIHQQCKNLQVYAKVVKPIKSESLYFLISEIQRSGRISIKTPNKAQVTPLSKLECTIMVVEDNPVNKFLSNTIIKNILPKCRIIEADNGQEAVELFQKEDMDLIFMDIQMPVLSGFEATAAIRKIENDKNRIPIIALTARTIKGEMEKCKTFGMDDYITKPVVAETIESIITQYLVSDNPKIIAS